MIGFFRGLSLNKKIKSNEPLDRAYYALFLQRKGKAKSIKKLLPLLEDSDWNVRNAAVSTVVYLVETFPEIKENILNHLHKLVDESTLAVRLSILEAIGQLKDYTSKPYLVKILKESGYDLQYAAIRAIGYLDDVDVLFPLENVVYARDYITRRAAILSVVRISESAKEETKIEKLTPHIHIIIESYLEVEKLGKIICGIMDFGEPDQFPGMKGYTESAIVKLEGLIEQKDYSVELYQNFAKLIFPLYFPIDENVT